MHMRCLCEHKRKLPQDGDILHMFDAYPTTEHIPLVKKEKENHNNFDESFKMYLQFKSKAPLEKSVVSGVMSCSSLASS